MHLFNFLNYNSTRKLQKLAKNPYDLISSKDLVKRIKEYKIETEDLVYSYALERIDDTVLSTLEELSQESQLVQKMHMMQKGSVLNYIENYPSDNRKVLHTAMRGWLDPSSFYPEIKDELEKARKENERLESFIEKITEKKSFTTLIQIGIGGSSLGPKSLYRALEKYKLPQRNVYFISNVDPDNAAAVLSKINPKETLVVIVSKSGTTLETLTNEIIVKDVFLKSGCLPKDHFIMVTNEKSSADRPENYLEIFYIWDYVGGRFSSTSMVGGIMLSFSFGYKVFKEILRGANAMDKNALNSNFHENVPLVLAMIGIWNRNFLKYSTVAVLPYAECLRDFVAHLQQCDMESNGKHIDKQGNTVKFSTGPIIWGEPGTNSQHSFYQLLHQGTDIVPVEFIGFKRSQYDFDLSVEGTTSQEKLLANLFAQSIALAKGLSNENPNKSFEGNRPSGCLLYNQLTPYTIGSLLSLYEHKIVFQGFCWNINSFDQEGVQLGKDLSNLLLDIYKKEKHLEDFPEGSSFLGLLDNL